MGGGLGKVAGRHGRGGGLGLGNEVGESWDILGR